ncbi:MAG: hypothetical protein IT176_06315 [Acidobacteria bacterium]|nr:hypothetical protein [Acidobacteriota bacterium]
MKKRIVGTIDAARRAAADRRIRADQAGREYEQFLEQTAVPLLRQVAGVLRAEGFAFTVFTPGGSVRLMSDRSSDDYIELLLDATHDAPRVVGRTRRARGRRVLETERSIADRTPGALTEEDVLEFVAAELGPYVEK